MSGPRAVKVGESSTSRSLSKERQPSDESDQLKEIACTPRGYAMDDCMKREKMLDFICAYEVSATQYKAAIKTMITKNMKPSQIYGECAYTKEEICEPSGLGLRQLLVVGYTPRPHTVSNMDFAKFNSKCQEGKAIGISKPEDTLPWDASSSPILVVAEMVDERPAGSGVQLWALLNPQGGLRTSHSI